MKPTSGTTIQRPDLGAIAYEYMISGGDRGFIGLEILPVFDVQEQSSDYPKIPIEALLKMPTSIRRTKRGNYQRGDYEFESGTYSCEEYGWEEPVDDTERKLYQRFFDAEEVATMRATNILLRGHEIRAAAALFNSGNFTVGNVAIEWSTPATATPGANVKAAKQAMRAASGLMPNVMAMGLKVFENLVATAEISDLLQYTNPIELLGSEAKRRLLAQYFEVDRILVGGAIKDTAKQKKAFSLSDIWDDEYVGLYRTAGESKDLREPCVGRTFLWTEDSPQILTTEQYREEATRSDIYRVRHNVDEAFVFLGAGYLMGNITV